MMNLCSTTPDSALSESARGSEKGQLKINMLSCQSELEVGSTGRSSAPYMSTATPLAAKELHLNCVLRSVIYGHQERRCKMSLTLPYSQVIIRKL